jgi:hypothetical protein
MMPEMWSFDPMADNLLARGKFANWFRSADWASDKKIAGHKRTTFLSVPAQLGLGAVAEQPVRPCIGSGSLRQIGFRPS